MNINGLFNAYNMYMNNPQDLFSKLNIPSDYANDPQGAVQYLVNSGRISQQQLNQYSQMIKNMQSNPLIKMMFNK